MTGHYYFDEMRSSFNLVQNQLFALMKLNIYKTNCLNLSKCTSSSAEKGNVKKKSMKLRFLNSEYFSQSTTLGAWKILFLAQIFFTAS
jgi:hypothetical protein